MKKQKHQTLKRLQFVHGFNEDDSGANSIDKLIPKLQGRNVETINVDYGHFNLLDVFGHNDTVAKLIASYTKPGDIGIGYSNGCAVLLKAAQQGAPFKRLIFINPALKSDIEIPPGIECVDVFFTDSDIPTRFAKYLRMMPFTPKNFIWGEMGRTGYTGQDERVINLDMSNYIVGHNGAFVDEEALNLVASMINEKIKRT